MRASFDYLDERMQKLDEVLFNFNKKKPTKERVSKSDVLRMLCDLVAEGKMKVEKLLEDAKNE